MTYMISLLPHAEKLAPDNPFGLDPPPLYHQMRTYQALQDHSLVVNTYDTGTGKTVGALLGLLDPTRRGVNTLFIAPTNELIRQHAADVEDFLARHGLDTHVLRVDAATLRALPGERGYERAGERLKRLFDNPRDYGWDGRKPLMVVTNPDIFYYALYFSAYHPHDRRNLFEQFLTRFDYVIVDEFHYYSPKQLACFLFFFIICQEWGYLQAGRRLCLLSATPDDRVQDYLGRVFSDPGQVAWISPANEPAESVHYPTTPTLAPLYLEIREGTVDDFAAEGREQVRLAGWLDSGRDGAFISSALWRINQAYASLRSPRFEGRVSRLTGAETGESRRAAPAFPLILATPTVDIGYNFGKPGKLRQPLDFVVFDARTRDEFVQRLGRAGRVLGRSQTDVPAQAVALLDADACAALRPLNGQTLARSDLRQAVAAALPPRHDLYAYVRSYAVLEAFRPIFQLGRTVRPDMQEWVERLFGAVRDVFAPDSKRWYFGSLSGRMRRHEKLARIVHQHEYDQLADFVDEYLDWLRAAEVSATELERVLHALRHEERARQTILLPWVQAQYRVTESLFNFREAFQGPIAAVYDPHHLLADADLTLYDALHVAANFEADYFDSAAEFRRACSTEVGEADVYCRLTRHREVGARLRLGFEFREQRMPQEPWEKLHTRRPVALQGLKLRAELPGGGPAPLPTTLRRVFEEKFVVFLAVPESDRGRLLYLMRDRNLFARSLQVHFASEGSSAEYLAVVGTAAFIVHAELEGYFYLRERRASSAGIIV
jgi:CRISPR-associated endonuclease/helicase Cas3